jgi:hypothetical protein
MQRSLMLYIFNGHLPQALLNLCGMRRGIKAQLFEVATRRRRFELSKLGSRLIKGGPMLKTKIYKLLSSEPKGLMMIFALVFIVALVIAALF